MPIDVGKLAEERAQRYAPAPVHEPVPAGIVGMAITAILLSIYSGLAGFDMEEFPASLFVTLGIGFGGPFIYFKNQQVSHSRAWLKEYENLQRQQDGSQPRT